MANVFAPPDMRGKHVIPVPMDTTKVGLDVTLATAIPIDQGPDLVMPMDNANADKDILELNVMIVHIAISLALAVSKMIHKLGYL